MNGNFWVKASATLLLSVLSLPLASINSASVFAAENAAPTKEASTQGKPAAPAAAAAAKDGALVGKPAPAFTLTDSNGKKHSLSESAGKIVVLEWVNYSCPFVKRQYSTNAMQKMQKTYTGKGVVWYSICSSAPDRQGYGTPKEINEQVKANNASPTAYLVDTDGTVGHAYGATCTPTMFIINDKGVVAYSGAVDDNQTSDATEKINTNYIQKALDELLANKPVSVASTKAMGCSVKYATK